MGQSNTYTIYIHMNGQKILQDWKSSFDNLQSNFGEHKKKLQRKYDYIQKKIGKIKKPKKGSEKMVNIMYSALYNFDRVSFKTNRDFIFFWCDHNIDYYPLDKPLLECNKKRVALHISKNQKNSKIKFLDCSPEKATLAIVVENMQTSTVI